MKKYILAVAIVSGLIAVSGTASAQNKIGYMSVDQMVGLMPEVAKIDSQLQKYQADSLNATLSQLIQEYQYKDSILTKTDTSKTPKSILNQYKADLQNYGYQIQNWQSISQQAMQQKQEELLAPVYSKVISALNAVSKEKGYTFVFSKDALLVAPPGDDMLPMVAQKLGVKLPTQTGGQGPTNPVKQPTTRPANH